MKLTTKGRYAVTAMLDIAIQEHLGTNNLINLAEITARQDISLTYLEQLFMKLRKQQLVESTRGPGGGYCLARDARSITVADIINAVDENVNVTRCGGEHNCQGKQQCLTHELWQDLSDQISVFLGSVSLGQLVDRYKHKQENKSQTHPIQIH